MSKHAERHTEWCCTRTAGGLSQNGGIPTTDKVSCETESVRRLIRFQYKPYQWQDVGVLLPYRLSARCRGQRSKIDLLSDAESVIDLDPEIPDGALQLCMAEKKLDSAKVAGFAVDLGRLRPPHRVRAVNSPLEADTLDPTVHQPGILPS